MKRICPITYEWIESNDANPFDPKGLKQLSPHLKNLSPLQFTQEQLRSLSQEHKESLQLCGGQPKVSMKLEVKSAEFSPDPRRGRYVIKAQHPTLELVPENESITLHLANIGEIKTAPFGLVDIEDNTFALWTRRVDRIGQATKLGLRSLASLLPEGEEATTETLIELINEHTTFPVRERAIFYQTFLFNFIVSNTEMHAGKWQLLTDKNGVTGIAPLFGIRNTALTGICGLESSLPLADNGSRLDKSTLYQYLAIERLQLPKSYVTKISQNMLSHAIAWKLAIDRSYLSSRQKFDYQQILTERVNRLR